MKDLELRIFRFDNRQDYEAYYKPYVYNNYENFASLYDLLLQVNDDDIYFEFEKNENAFVLINNKPFRLNTSLSQILQDEGYELKIEPLSTKRAIKDLIINKDDFYDRFKLISHLVSEEDKKIYEKYDYLYYTSKILKYLPNYLGDSFFYFVGQMIEKYPNKKENFLKIIKDESRGIFYHIKTKNLLLEQTIDFLKQEILKAKLFNETLLNDKNPILESFRNEFKEPSDIKYNFKDFNIGLFTRKDIKFSDKLEAKFVSFLGSEKSTGFEFLNLDEKLSYRMAADIILQAYDAGCDFLIVDTPSDFYMLDSCSKKLMQISGREFDDFYILSHYEFFALMAGIKMESLKNHSLQVTLI
ncbi:DUF5644 domain-containing protein [Campylobacter sp. TTU_617]|uniref:DUF5644 domain-containing protein n=2 Tax=unclassified Campylobacter TaxID=2593542 RepID=UPI0019047163|nr:DUF5644 domain-containing protein [Campylobacter sp. TTU_617]MBK1971687.1 DUF5644 domain-containing protein [Campylobacter sp. TTU_617]